jgi:DUF438 domain-containing protein
MSEFFTRNNGKIELMKNFLVKMDKELITPDEIKREFKEILSDITPADVAEFWINMSNKLIYIRYFAVRNSKIDYLGTLEATQDITEIKKLQGEKRIHSKE